MSMYFLIFCYYLPLDNGYLDKYKKPFTNEYFVQNLLENGPVVLVMKISKIIHVFTLLIHYRPWKKGFLMIVYIFSQFHLHALVKRAV